MTHNIATEEARFQTSLSFGYILLTLPKNILQLSYLLGYQRSNVYIYL